MMNRDRQFSRCCACVKAWMDSIVVVQEEHSFDPCISFVSRTCDIEVLECYCKMVLRCSGLSMVQGF